MGYHMPEVWLQWVDQLSEKGYVIIDNFVTHEDYLLIRNFFLAKLEAEAFKKAGIGTSGDFTVINDLRGDFIYWLEKNRDKELNVAFDVVEELVFVLNRYCYLSLSGYEFHLAHYPAGAGYQRHLDQFKGRNNRMISCVLYLNKDWVPEQGGELKIYLPEGELLVEPLAGRMVLFKSAEIEHEVMATTANRYSLTGWLLYKQPGLGLLT